MRKERIISRLRISRFCYGANTSGMTMENLSEFIRIRAYQLFERRGRQSGFELDDWLQAEREMKERCAFDPAEM